MGVCQEGTGRAETTTRENEVPVPSGWSRKAVTSLLGLIESFDVSAWPRDDKMALNGIKHKLTAPSAGEQASEEAGQGPTHVTGLAFLFAWSIGRIKPDSQEKERKHFLAA
jgi:hypothetical protein